MRLGFALREGIALPHFQLLAALRPSPLALFYYYCCRRLPFSSPQSTLASLWIGECECEWEPALSISLISKCNPSPSSIMPSPFLHVKMERNRETLMSCWRDSLSFVCLFFCFVFFFHFSLVKCGCGGSGFSFLLPNFCFPMIIWQLFLKIHIW